jgi:hypothetical protein
MINTSLNFLKDSNANLKVKTMEERVEVCSLIRNISGIKMTCWNSRMGTGMNDKQINYSHGPAQTKQQVG